MQKKEHKKGFNIIIAVVAVIVIGCVAVAGIINGWFENGDSNLSGTSPAGSCMIQIRCDAIFDNMEELKGGKEQHIPSDGIILKTCTVQFYEGETVFDVLKKVCADEGIHLEYETVLMGSNYYIEGINHLYELDCGNESGWIYKVNGQISNYGCSDYELKDGDSVVWAYTCSRFGEDTVSE